MLGGALWIVSWTSNAFTADGTRAVIELWRIPADGGEPQPLGVAMEGVRLYGVRIHPDGRRIAFTTGRSSAYSAFEVWVLEDFLHGRKPRNEGRRPGVPYLKTWEH